MKSIALLSLALLLTAHSAFAAAAPPGQGLNTIQKGDCQKLNVNCQNFALADPSRWVDTALTVLASLLSFMALLAVIMVIWAGVRYMTSGGDEKKTEKAKANILYAVIGLVIIGLSAILVNMVIGILFQ